MGRKAAVDDDRLPRDEAGLVGDQEGNKVCDVLGSPQAWRQGVAREAVKHPLGNYVANRRGDDHSRGDAHSADAFAAVLRSDIPRERVDRSLRHGVHRPDELGEVRGDRARVDDHAATPLQHVRDRVLARQRVTSDVDAKDAVEYIPVDVDDRSITGCSVTSGQRGIVMKDVESAELAHRAVDHRLKLSFVANVDCDAGAPAPIVAEVLYYAFRSVLVDVGGNDGCAAPGEDLRGRPPDARTRSGDDRNLSLEVRHFGTLLVFVGSACGYHRPLLTANLEVSDC